MNIPGIGEVTGCIIAYRSWNYWNTPAGPRLLSLTAERMWHDEPMKACCMEDRGFCRGEEITHPHGVYALKKPEDMNSFHAELRGEIALWGKIIEHDGGYRAEYGYPIALYTGRDISEYRRGGERSQAKILTKLRDFYGLRLEPSNQTYSTPIGTSWSSPLYLPTQANQKAVKKGATIKWTRWVPFGGDK